MSGSRDDASYTPLEPHCPTQMDLTISAISALHDQISTLKEKIREVKPLEEGQFSHMSKLRKLLEIRRNSQELLHAKEGELSSLEKAMRIYSIQRLSEELLLGQVMIMEGNVREK